MIKFYGNQYGHWVEFTGKNAIRFKRLMKMTGKSAKQVFSSVVTLALRMYK